MTLLSVEFALLFLITAILYFVFPLKFRWIVLLASSIAFYFYGGTGTGFFMLFTILCIYVDALWLDRLSRTQREYFENNPELAKTEKQSYRSKIQHKKRLVLALGLVICIGFLVYLKYFNFLSVQAITLLKLLGVSASAPTVDLALPLGISFYTLQAAGYMIDVYRGKVPAEKNFAKIALFVSFFPQIIQGPIGRYQHLAPQLYEGHKFDSVKCRHGLELALWGLVKKLAFAEYVGVIADTIFDGYQNYEGFLILIGSIAYGLQVYADFSGGMDIIRGIAQIFGIDMAVNFERPYFARSIAEFWRRWHITLGAWMRDYVFYPLSLSRAFAKLGKNMRKILGSYIGKMLPSFLASFIAFLLVGVWHGSSWKYVAYGLWNSVIITSSILLDPAYKKLENKLCIKTDCFSWKFFQIARTFFLVSIGRIFSRAASFMDALRMLKRMFMEFNPWIFTDGSLHQLGLSDKEIDLAMFMLMVIFTVSLLQERGIHLRQKLDEQNILFRWLVIVGAIVFLLIYGAYGAAYTASDFVYQQF